MLLRCLTATKMNIAPTNLSISVSLKLIVQLSRPDLKLKTIYTTNIYLFKVNNRNTGEIRSKLTIKTPKRRCWHRSGVFIVNFEHNLHVFIRVLIFWVAPNSKPLVPRQPLSISTIRKLELNFFSRYFVLLIRTTMFPL